MKKLIIIITVFFLGWLCNNAYSYLAFFNTASPYALGTNEQSSPSDWIKQNKILTTEKYVMIRINNASLARFSDTNSMDPVFDREANSIEIKPEIDKLRVGDIISFKTTKGLIIHRIIEIGEDEYGWYCKTKGDNNQHPDKEKIRYEEIKGVVIGVIY